MLKTLFHYKHISVAMIAITSHHLVDTDIIISLNSRFSLIQSAFSSCSLPPLSLQLQADGKLEGSVDAAVVRLQRASEQHATELAQARSDLLQRGRDIDAATRVAAKATRIAGDLERQLREKNVQLQVCQRNYWFIAFICYDLFV